MIPMDEATETRKLDPATLAWSCIADAFREAMPRGWNKAGWSEAPGISDRNAVGIFGT